jgi:hypothetical protein
VSLVDHPGLPKATFAVVKADGSTDLRKFKTALRTPDAPAAALIKIVARHSEVDKDRIAERILGLRSRGKTPLAQEFQYQPMDLLARRKEGVAHRNYGVIRHAGNFGSLDRYAAVVWIANDQRGNRIDAAATRDNAEAVIDPAEERIGRCQFGDELLAGGAKEFSVSPAILEDISDFAAPVGGSQHDDASEVLRPISMEISTYHEAAHRMADKMQLARNRSRKRHYLRVNLRGNGLDRPAGGGVVKIECAIAARGEEAR